VITRVLSTGLLAGLLAGLAIAALQHVTTTPLIRAAEVYENGEQQAASRAPAQVGDARLILVHAPPDARGAAQAGGEQWAPPDGAERLLLTTIATVGTAIGFALLLIGAMLASGDAIDDRRAIAWAAAAFIATGLAPAAGLAPELPGMPAADLVARQAWWFLTASLTALSLWLFLRLGNPWLRGAALLVLLAPHVLGAPNLDEGAASKVPPDLAARFAAMSLAVQAALWIAVGFAVGALWPRMAGRGEARAAGLN
jgi:cobalt transporter subunit CbtA